jgi:hypothetical protein
LRTPPPDFFAAAGREPPLADLRDPAADLLVPTDLRVPGLEAFRDPPFEAFDDPPLALRGALLLREPPDEDPPAPAGG